jgi:hypothetical protein
VEKGFRKFLHTDIEFYLLNIFKFIFQHSFHRKEYIQSIKMSFFKAKPSSFFKAEPSSAFGNTKISPSLFQQSSVPSKFNPDKSESSIFNQFSLGQVKQESSIFGKLSNFNPVKSESSIFGQSSAFGQQESSVFGQTFAREQPPSVKFGQPIKQEPVKQESNIFGQTFAREQSPSVKFGQQESNIFGQSAKIESSAFGQQLNVGTPVKQESTDLDKELQLVKRQISEYTSQVNNLANRLSQLTSENEELKMIIMQQQKQLNGTLGNLDSGYLVAKIDDPHWFPECF